MMTGVHVLILSTCTILGASHARGQQPGGAGRAEADWREAMSRVHARFHGRPGTFAHFGDSITVSLAFWTPLKYARKNAPAEMDRAFRRVEGHMRPSAGATGRVPSTATKAARRSVGPTRTWRNG